MKSYRASRLTERGTARGQAAFDQIRADSELMRRAYPHREGMYAQQAGAPILQELEAQMPGGFMPGLGTPASPPSLVTPQGRTVASEGYEAPVGAVPRINATRLYQQEGRGRGAGYLNNPFEVEGRKAMLRQGLSAPLGGHLRSALQGQEVFGHTITNAQARMAEQAAAVLATGVGSWGLLEAIDALNGDPQQTPGTMQMV